MAWTQTDLDRLERAYAAGTRRVTVDGKSVEYNTLEELSQAISRVRSALSVQAGTASTRVSYIVTGRD